MNIWDNVLCSLVNRGCGQPGLKRARRREPFLPLLLFLDTIFPLLWLLVFQDLLNVLLFLVRISIGLILKDQEDLNSITGEGTLKRKELFLECIFNSL